MRAQVWPGASNVIAGSTGFSVDVRAKTDGVRERVVASMVAMLEGVCGRRGVPCRINRKHDAAAVRVAPLLIPFSSTQEIPCRSNSAPTCPTTATAPRP